MADDGADDPFFQALMQLTDTNKKVSNKLVIWFVCLEVIRTVFAVVKVGPPQAFSRRFV